MPKKKISGYTRDLPGATPLSGVPVTIKYHKNNTPVAAGGQINGSPNPINSDANGYWEWTCDLSPGDVYADSDFGDGDRRIRSNREMMSIGINWQSEIEDANRHFTDGSVNPSGTPSVTFSDLINEVTIGPIKGIVGGQNFETFQDNTLAIDANPSLAVRKSYVVMSMSTAGSTKGEQSIKIVYGTANNTYPSLPQANTAQFVIAGFVTNQNSSVSTRDAAVKMVRARPVNFGLVLEDEINPNDYATTDDHVKAVIAGPGGVLGVDNITFGQLSDVAATVTGANRGLGIVRTATQWALSDPKTLVTVKYAGSTALASGTALNMIFETDQITLDRDKTYDIIGLVEYEVYPDAANAATRVSTLSSSAIIRIDGGNMPGQVYVGPSTGNSSRRTVTTTESGAQALINKLTVRSVALGQYTAGDKTNFPEVSLRASHQASTAWGATVENCRAILMAIPRA